MQKNWLYLHPIFTSEEIQTQMPKEARKFENVDTIWRTVMTVSLHFALFNILIANFSKPYCS
jgi:hypothetical protein